jgi:hypothetical protein
MQTGPIQPLASALAASQSASAQSAARAKPARVGSVARYDTFERQVETTQAIDDVNAEEHNPSQQRKKRKPQPEPEEKHQLDIQA